MAVADKKVAVAVIGECMIEVKLDPEHKFGGPDMPATVGYGGDTLNFSVYMARQGVEVDYVTAIGDDPISDWVLRQWREEGIGCELVERVAGAVPGLYLIDIDEHGERSFFYWRDQAPARRIFDDGGKARVLYEELRRYPYLYLSGISLALYGSAVRERLLHFIDEFRAGGGRIVFDNNYRPRQWPDAAEARATFEQMYRRSDVALPTLDDERLLFGEEDAASVVERIRSWGADEIVLKQGAEGCTVATASGVGYVDAVAVEKIVDTTAAGDSFNAGYLAARLRGADPLQAAARGNELAARVVQCHGAVIPRED